jgi:hypothetical protein
MMMHQQTSGNEQNLLFTARKITKASYECRREESGGAVYEELQGAPWQASNMKAVLLGRGKSNLNHPGNRYFQGKRVTIRCRSREYKPCESGAC